MAQKLIAHDFLKEYKRKKMNEGRKVLPKSLKSMYLCPKSIGQHSLSEMWSPRSDREIYFYLK